MSVRAKVVADTEDGYPELGGNGRLDRDEVAMDGECGSAGS